MPARDDLIGEVNGLIVLDKKTGLFVLYHVRMAAMFSVSKEFHKTLLLARRGTNQEF